MDKEKIKELKLPMKFNAGLQKYEPELLVKKTEKETNSKINWKWIILIFISIITLAVFGIILANLLSNG